MRREEDAVQKISDRGAWLDWIEIGTLGASEIEEALDIYHPQHARQPANRCDLRRWREETPAKVPPVHGRGSEGVGLGI